MRVRQVRAALVTAIYLCTGIGAVAGSQSANASGDVNPIRLQMTPRTGNSDHFDYVFQVVETGIVDEAEPSALPRFKIKTMYRFYDPDGPQDDEVDACELTPGPCPKRRMAVHEFDSPAEDLTVSEFTDDGIFGAPIMLAILGGGPWRFGVLRFEFVVTVGDDTYTASDEIFQIKGSSGTWRYVTREEYQAELEVALLETDDTPYVSGVRVQGQVEKRLPFCRPRAYAIDVD